MPMSYEKVWILKWLMWTLACYAPLRSFTLPAALGNRLLDQLCTVEVLVAFVQTVP